MTVPSPKSPVAGPSSQIVSLQSHVVAAIVDHARQIAPAECCGLLVGHGNVVVEAVRTRNIADRPTRFLIDPEDHIRARREARARGLHVVGFYHSHPHSDARPSAADRAEAAYPDHLYLIVSLASEPPAIGLFRLCGGNFREVASVTVD